MPLNRCHFTVLQYKEQFDHAVGIVRPLWFKDMFEVLDVHGLSHGLGAFVLEALASDLLVDPLFKITATSTDGFVELFDEVSNFHWFLLVSII